MNLIVRTYVSWFSAVPNRKLKKLSIMETEKCVPGTAFTEKEIEGYMNEAIEFVKTNHPEAKGRDWDIAIKKKLAVMYSPKFPNSNNAVIFSEQIWEGYYSY